MNTSDNVKKVLCFGDSNTWGFIPKTGERYSPKVRWTGLLQDRLGDDFEVIEEGLNARTTDIDDPKNIGKNGLKYLIPCLQTHNPLDIVVLFLGTNDLKERFNRQPKQVASGINKLIDTILEFSFSSTYHTPHLVLICPSIVDESVDGVKEKYLGAERKSKELPKLYSKIAKDRNLHYINLQEHLSPSKSDGYHFDKTAHSKVCDLLHDMIKIL